MQLDALQLKGIVQDVERGFADDLKPQPWQTCTCIGSWHYDRRIFERHGYVPAKAVIQRLCDTVSKNGNLLLSKSDATKLAGPLLFTTTTTPGLAMDGIFYWTGKGLNWDVYGHTAGDGSVCVPDANGYRAIYGPRGTRKAELFAHDPHWKDLILFYEYFSGDTGEGLGASHQTGWTALVASLIDEWRTG